MKHCWYAYGVGAAVLGGMIWHSSLMQAQTVLLALACLLARLFFSLHAGVCGSVVVVCDMLVCGFAASVAHKNW
jgi:hypothetical protein